MRLKGLVDLGFVAIFALTGTSAWASPSETELSKALSCQSMLSPTDDFDNVSPTAPGATKDFSVSDRVAMTIDPSDKSSFYIVTSKTIYQEKLSCPKVESIALLKIPGEKIPFMVHCFQVVNGRDAKPIILPNGHYHAQIEDLKKLPVLLLHDQLNAKSKAALYLDLSARISALKDRKKNTEDLNFITRVKNSRNLFGAEMDADGVYFAADAKQKCKNPLCTMDEYKKRVDGYFNQLLDTCGKLPALKAAVEAQRKAISNVPNGGGDSGVTSPAATQAND